MSKGPAAINQKNSINTATQSKPAVDVKSRIQEEERRILEYMKNMDVEKQFAILTKVQNAFNAGSPMMQIDTISEAKAQPELNINKAENSQSHAD